jgi:SMI1-KNR4 cell-wall
VNDSWYLRHLQPTLAESKDMIRIEEPGPSLSEIDVAGLERRVNARLPRTYRLFLVRNNGGVPIPETVDVPGAPGSPTDVQVFFGIGRGVESSDLDWNAQTFLDRIPKGILPIACDSGGNLFCVGLSDSTAGQIFYCDLERAAHLYLVAPDFDAFLEKIRPFEM